MTVGRPQRQRHRPLRGGMERTQVVGENGALMEAKALALDGEFPGDYFVRPLSDVGQQEILRLEIQDWSHATYDVDVPTNRKSSSRLKHTVTGSEGDRARQVRGERGGERARMGRFHGSSIDTVGQ